MFLHGLAFGLSVSMIWVGPFLWVGAAGLAWSIVAVTVDGFPGS
jgi:hypothetical protein